MSSLMMRRRLMMAMGMEEDEVKPYRLINSVTLEEANKTIIIDTDSDGNAFELDDIVIVLVGSCDQTANSLAHVTINKTIFINSFTIPKAGTDISNYGGILHNNGMVVMADSAVGSNGAVSVGNVSRTYVKTYLQEKVKSVSASMAPSTAEFEIGATLTLYGR